MWLTTWTKFDRPQYAEHPTEAAAEAHAKRLVDSRTTTHATCYLIVLPDEEQPK